MEDVLASIRGVLSKVKAPMDIGKKSPEGHLRHQEEADNGILIVDPSIMVLPRHIAEEGNKSPTGAAWRAELAMNIDETEFWEERQRLFEQINRLRHKVSIATTLAGIGISTGLGVLTAIFFGKVVGALGYGVLCVVTVSYLRFAFGREPSGHQKAAGR